MKQVPVLIAGGGPVGMILAHDLARRGIACLLAERNPTTTAHPKMDITNGRSMELLRRAGLDTKLRAVAIPEDHSFDVAWITDLSGHALHRFAYPTVAQARARIRAANDGSQTAEPPMRVSQVIIEPVLKQAIDEADRVEVRFGWTLERFEEDGRGVTVTLQSANGDEERVRADYLVGCDGGGSRVRRQLGIGQTGEARISERYIVHFESDDRALLQRWGPAWHYQSNHGTLVAQNDRDIWTLLAQLPPGMSAQEVDPSRLLCEFAGRAFAHRVVLANAWAPNLLVADSYGSARVWIAGDAVHQYVPTGGYGMNTGVGDAFDLGWKLAATLKGFGGPGLIASYAAERRPIGLRNCAAARHHSATRRAISALYDHAASAGGTGSVTARDTLASGIAALGNAENESMGIEHGYAYPDSPIVCGESGARVPDDPLVYEPGTVPGARLPSFILEDGVALYDRLGDWFTLLIIGDGDEPGFAAAGKALGVPLAILRVAPRWRALYACDLLLVRPDQHIAWRGRHGDGADAPLVLRRALGWT